MRCHVCGKEITTAHSTSAHGDLPVLDGWAWTLTAEGTLDVVTCRDCTLGMRVRVGVALEPGTREYDDRVAWAVHTMREERRAVAFAAGGGAIRVWIDEALAPEDRGRRKEAAFVVQYGASDGELAKLMSSKRGALVEDGKPGPLTEAAVRQLQEALNTAIPFDEEKLVAWAKRMMPQRKNHDSWAAACEQAFGALGDPRTGSAVASVIAKADEKLSKVEQPVSSQQPGFHPVYESDWTGAFMPKCKLPAVEQKSKLRCAITGKLASEMDRATLIWETWKCFPDEQAICVASPCSFEVRRRLGMDPNDAWAADGPWGKGFSREQILAWMARPPAEFLERTEKALREVADLYRHQCPRAAAQKPCAHCGKPSITLFEKSVPVPLCGNCTQAADAAGLLQAEKDEIVRRTATGDRYAWQRLVEAAPACALWQSKSAMRADRREVARLLRKSAAEDRRRFLKQHPGEHLVEVLGMADFFGPKVR